MFRLNDHILALMPEKLGGKTQAEIKAELSTDHDIEYGNHVYNGVIYPWLYPKSMLEAIQNFEVRDDDVYVITYPKSGFHWLVEIIGLVVNDGNGDFDRMKAVIDFTVATKESPQDPESAKPGSTPKSHKSPRFIHAHFPISGFPSHILKSKAKIIYLVRNPKDTFTSMIRFANVLGPSPSSENMTSFIWHNITGLVPFGSWFDHVLDYWEHRHDDNFLFLKYEEIHKDLRGHVCQIAKLVGKDLTDDVIDAIVEQVSFAAMQKTYKGIEEKPDGSQYTQFAGVSHLRKGTVGSWKNDFTVAESALLDKVYTEKLRGSGLVFEFE